MGPELQPVWARPLSSHLGTSPCDPSPPANSFPSLSSLLLGKQPPQSALEWGTAWMGLAQPGYSAPSCEVSGSHGTPACKCQAGWLACYTPGCARARVFLQSFISKQQTQVLWLLQCLLNLGETEEHVSEFKELNADRCRDDLSEKT